MNTNIARYADMERNLAHIETSFNLPLQSRDMCDIYYLLRWECSYFLRKAVRGNSIIREGVLFTIHWLHPNQKARILEIVSSGCQVALSFRRQRGARDGYVIPKIYEE